MLSKIVLYAMLPVVCFGALSVHQGSFAMNTGTGTQTITGVGFLPKVVLFTWTEATADTAIGGYGFGFGVGISPSMMASIVVRNVDGTLNADSKLNNVRCIMVINGSGITTEAAEFTSLTADGFTINVTTPGIGAVIQYVALGGSTLSNVTLVPFSAPTAVSSVAVTGAGFMPDSAIIFTSGQTSAVGTSDTYAHHGIGFAGTGGTQAGFGNSMLSSSNADTSAQSASKVIYLPDTSTMWLEGTLTSFDASGATISYSVVQPNSVKLWAVFFKGLGTRIGSLTQPTSTGTQSVTGTTFTPIFTFFGGFCHTAGSGQLADGFFNFGMARSAAIEGTIFAGARSGNNQAQYALNRTASILCYTPTLSGTPTLNSKAEFTSHNADGFTVNWQNVDATQRQVLYMSIGEPAIVAGAARRHILIQ